MKIAVVIITYKRPEGLRKLLDALLHQDLSESQIQALNLIVVDNDPAKSASVVVSEFEGSELIHITCLNEERQGIPYARNKGMHYAIDGNDYFAFIDDDEYPTSLWIKTLLAVALDLGSDCILGPVVPVFPEGTPRWVSKSRVFEGWIHEDRSRIFEAASNNVLINCQYIKRQGIDFDERMKATGGSDYRFFRECVERGMVIHWSADAFVYEDIPRSRTKISWMAQRQIRLGNTFAVDARLTGRLPRIIKLYAFGLARIVVGIIALPMLIVSSRLGTSAAVHLLRGVGIVSGIHGYRHDEYDKSRLDRERSVN